MEAREPVDDHGEGDDDREEPWDADDEVGDRERGWPVQAVGAVFDVEGAVFEEGGYVCDCHEGHEGAAEEQGVDDWLNAGLVGGEAQPDCAHEDGKSDVHGEAESVGEGVTEGFEKKAVA